jgi:hypothetical protein
MFPQAETLMGGSFIAKEPPITPSGRQDLNLRPLDPQYGQRVALTSGNRKSLLGGVQYDAPQRPSGQLGALRCSTFAPSVPVNDAPARRSHGPRTYRFEITIRLGGGAS